MVLTENSCIGIALAVLSPVKDSKYFWWSVFIQSLTACLAMPAEVPEAGSLPKCNNLFKWVVNKIWIVMSAWFVLPNFSVFYTGLRMQRIGTGVVEATNCLNECADSGELKFVYCTVSALCYSTRLNPLRIIVTGHVWKGGLYTLASAFVLSSTTVREQDLSIFPPPPFHHSHISFQWRCYPD
jgi:hypothetical protein